MGASGSEKLQLNELLNGRIRSWGGGVGDGLMGVFSRSHLYEDSDNPEKGKEIPDSRS